MLTGEQSKPRCGNCRHFYVPSAEPQWKHMRSRVGECVRITIGKVRPEVGSICSVIESKKRPRWLVAGGGILVDADYGCINFEERNANR
jgi:hypothetical protein